jgi:hypothetical protein
MQTVYISKDLTLQGGYMPGAWTTPDPALYPTLDAQGAGRVILIIGTVSVTLKQLDITGGDATGLGGGPSLYGYDGVGGGVYVVSATTTLRGNRIHHNMAGRNDYGGGGGVYLYDSLATLEHNQIYWNTAGISDTGASLSGEGGGVAINLGAATLTGNVIEDNDASTSGWGIGGGLYMEACAPTLTDNLIQRNSASTAITGAGGGIFVGIYSDPYLVNTVLRDNQSGFTLENSQGAAVAVEGAMAHLVHTTFMNNTGGDGAGLSAFAGSTVWLTNTIMAEHTTAVSVEVGSAATLAQVLWFNNTTTYYTGAGALDVTGEISGDPHFIATDHHLDTGSLAIDAGIQAGVPADIDGEARPNGIAPDLGADEYIARCYAQLASSPGITHSSYSGLALQVALDNAMVDDEVKVAGMCAGAVYRTGGGFQTAYISRPLTLRGGYTLTDWSVSDPISHPTVLDAQREGRVINVVDTPATVENLTLRGGSITGHGGGIRANVGITLVTFTSWTARPWTARNAAACGVGPTP